MKVYLVRPKPDPNWNVLMTIYKPTKKVTDTGDIHWEFEKMPVQMSPNAFARLGVTDNELPKPGECVLVSIAEK